MELTVNVDQPVSDALAALVQLVVAIKAKSPIENIVAGELSNVMKLISELPQIPADVKSVPQECLNSAALGAAALVGAALGLTA